MVSRSGAAASKPAENINPTGRTASLIDGTPVNGRARVEPIGKWLTADGKSPPLGANEMMDGTV